MKILLIYKSKTGFTEKYANWIKEELNCDIEKISNIHKIDLNSYDLVIFGSRIHAGRIDGLDKIKKLNLDKKLIIFATGATPKETDSIMEVWNSNLTLEKKDNKSKEDIGMQNSIKKSYDISSKKRIKPLLDYIKSL